MYQTKTNRLALRIAHPKVVNCQRFIELQRFYTGLAQLENHRAIAQPCSNMENGGPSHSMEVSIQSWGYPDPHHPNFRKSVQ